MYPVEEGACQAHIIHQLSGFSHADRQCTLHGLFESQECGLIDVPLSIELAS